MWSFVVSEIRVIDSLINSRIDAIMDSRFKRPSDGEPSENSKRQRVENNASGGFASGEAGRHSTRFRPIAQLQEQHGRHESTSFEVPASQQAGIEYLLGLRNQLQDTHNWSHAVLEGLDQQIAKIQQQAGSSEGSASGSHSGYHQQDTRLLENSFHPPTRDEQRIPQHPQEEVLYIDDYLIASPSDSDHEPSYRDLFEAHGPAGSIPARSHQLIAMLACTMQTLPATHCHDEPLGGLSASHSWLMPDDKKQSSWDQDLCNKEENSHRPAKEKNVNLMQI
jgi:hypothetical protein